MSLNPGSTDAVLQGPKHTADTYYRPCQPPSSAVSARQQSEHRAVRILQCPSKPRAHLLALC